MESYKTIDFIVTVSVLFYYNDMKRKFVTKRKYLPSLIYFVSEFHILEVSSGTGQHITFFASEACKLGVEKVFWQPTEYDESKFKSILAYKEHLEVNKFGNS